MRLFFLDVGRSAGALACRAHGIAVVRHGDAGAGIAEGDCVAPSVLDDPGGITLMTRLMRDAPALWNEDIGV